MSSGPASATAPALRVQSVRMISGSCDASSNK